MNAFVNEKGKKEERVVRLLRIGVLKWLKGALDGHCFVVVSHFESNTCHRMKDAINPSIRWMDIGFHLFSSFFSGIHSLQQQQQHARSVYVISSASPLATTNRHPHHFGWRQRIKHFHQVTAT